MYLWLFLCLYLHVQAQEDTLQANRYIVRSTLYGIGHTNVLETYLSPVEYSGLEARVARESMRNTRLMNGNVSAQTWFQAGLSLLDNRAGTSREIAFSAQWNYAWHYRFCINEKLKILAGPYLDATGGFVYNLRNSNNPVQAKASLQAGASGMAIYRFRVKGYPMTARYQANLPLLGVMFSPEYGQPYYEMTLSNDWGKNLCFIAPFNAPSLRQLLTLDLPIQRVTLRLGYQCDIRQSHVNELKSHAWSHTFMVGFVKNLYLPALHPGSPSTLSPF